ncbi:SIS domain-containing protein [Devosia rhodophyticola]|uniref:SIS domain-containing protein n=2 Tax=Devosia TaxID=46913 RepID=A0ABY7YU95_9HYPH|nr:MULTISPECIES: SIS domain-containing protein [Devosia]WDR03528.1 SIS domain-containing protein [Devosia algicola]WDR04752.1 SIS domain-containing protein [Devosia rhodophyticola]
MNATKRSIVEQFAQWRGLADQGVRAEPGTRYVVVGCGTSFYLAQTIAAQLNAQHIDAIAAPGHEWTIRPHNYAVGPVTVIAVSRSGESTETVEAARASQARGSKVIGLTCEPASALAGLADAVLMAETHPDEGIVMTASASLMLLLGLQFAGVELDLPALADMATATLDAMLAVNLDDIGQRRHLVFLGGGALYGIAAEGALKSQEMSCTVTQVFHPLEYRHGPISLADDTMAIVMLYGADDVAAEAKLTDDVRALGALVMAIGGPGDVEIPNVAPAAVRGLVSLPALQMLGERLAVLRQLDSAAPRHLTKVVKVA